MKKFLFSLTLLLNVAFAHSIPPELLQFMAENPDASDEQTQAFLESSGLASTGAQLWGSEADSQNPQSFNLPPKLVDFLLENPNANEPEILTFINSDSSLADAGWAEKIKTLNSGLGFEDGSPFSLNDLVLLNQLGQTFDEVYPSSSQTALASNSKTINWWQFIKNYVLLGIKHILEGLDHILFVMSLVLLLPPWRRILKMVTAFTLAHSVTLILAGTNLLTLSSRVVEPIIALSIAYMAVTTVFLSKRYPWFARAHASLLVIFIFGLFHGLGFAGQFAEVSPGAGRLVPSLLLFNVGVEFGQLIILAAFLPFLWSLKQLKLDRYFVPVFAAIISALALWWVVVRLFF